MPFVNMSSPNMVFFIIFILYNIAELGSSFGHESLHYVKNKVPKALGALSLGEIKIVQCFRLGTWKDHAVNPSLCWKLWGEGQNTPLSREIEVVVWF